MKFKYNRTSKVREMYGKQFLKPNMKKFGKDLTAIIAKDKPEPFIEAD